MPYFSCTGVAKELFTLAIQRLCKETGILEQTSDGRSVWFSHNCQTHVDFIRRGEQFVLDQKQQLHSSGGRVGGSKSFMEILISLSRFKIPQKNSVTLVSLSVFLLTWHSTSLSNRIRRRQRLQRPAPHHHFHQRVRTRTSERIFSVLLRDYWDCWSA